jgi:hypothetical protein
MLVTFWLWTLLLWVILLMGRFLCNDVVWSTVLFSMFAYVLALWDLLLDGWFSCYGSVIFQYLECVLSLFWVCLGCGFSLSGSGLFAWCMIHWVLTLLFCVACFIGYYLFAVYSCLLLRERYYVVSVFMRCTKWYYRARGYHRLLP